MANTLKYIQKKYQLSYNVPMPIILKGIGRHSGIKDLVRELGFKTGAEIGTKDGYYAKELCIALPKLKLYCIDPWISYEDYHESWAQDQDVMDLLFEKSKDRLSTYNCKIIRKTSMEAIKDFDSNSLDFVFIDANHEYNFVLEDITQWTKKVRKGGIIFGHDYAPDHMGVMRAIQEYVKQNKINPWFILHVKGQTDCWMFVK